MDSPARPAVSESRCMTANRQAKNTMHDPNNSMLTPSHLWTSSNEFGFISIEGFVMMFAAPKMRKVNLVTHENTEPDNGDL